MLCVVHFLKACKALLFDPPLTASSIVPKAGRTGSDSCGDSEDAVHRALQEKEQELSEFHDLERPFVTPILPTLKSFSNKRDKEADEQDVSSEASGKPLTLQVCTRVYRT